MCSFLHTTGHIQTVICDTRRCITDECSNGHPCLPSSSPPHTPFPCQILERAASCLQTRPADRQNSTADSAVDSTASGEEEEEEDEDFDPYDYDMEDPDVDVEVKEKKG